MAIYLMCIYGHDEREAWFRDAWAKTGKRLDMGKSCVRFKKLDDVPLKVIGQAIKRAPVKRFIEHYESSIKGAGTRRSAEAARKKAARKKVAKKSAPAKRATTKYAAAKKAAARRPKKKVGR